MPSRSFDSAAGGLTTQYLVSQSPFANNLTALTLAAWVYMTDTPVFADGDYYPIFFKGLVTVGEEQLSGPNLAVFASADGALQLWGEIGFTGVNAGLFTVLPVDALTQNAWHHIAMTLSPDNTLRLYLDGAEITLFDGTSNAQGSGVLSFDDSSTPWAVGVDVVPPVDNSAGTQGSMSDLRIYSRALSGAEIALLADFGEPSTANLEARWKMCGIGTDEADSSGNNRTLVNHGTTISQNQPAAFCGAATCTVYPNQVPRSFTAGSTVAFTRAFLPCYPSSAWNYTIYWNGATTKFQASGVPQPDDSFLITITPAESAQLAGDYQFVERVVLAATGETHDVTCPQSMTRVYPDPATAPAGAFLTWEEKTLEVLKQAAAGTLPQGMQGYQIAGRAVQFMSPKELTAQIGIFQSKVWRQRHPGQLGQKYGSTFSPTSDTKVC